MLEALLQFDQSLFQLLNNTWHSTIQDWLLPPIRNKYFWIPAYLLLAGWFLIRFKLRGLLAILTLVLTIAITDTVSHRVIKKSVKRPRPCKTFDPPEIRELIPCGSGYSFTSNHATNHFALATCLFLLIGHRWGRWRWPLFVWAGLIAYAQVYVGVHYPLDVLAGATLGILIGYIMGRAFNRFSGLEPGIVKSA
jgi:membrane-associated phospholipid phosphatase